jgi:hypothetical protein
MKWRHRIAQGFSPGSCPNEIALKALPAPRPRGAIPNRRSTPTLQYSITPRGRIRGRGRERSASRGQPMRIARQSSLRAAFIACGWGWDPFEPSAPKRHGGDAHSAALSGRVYGLPNPGLKPGLKPWAILFRHFMAIYASPHHPNTPRFPLCSSVAN